MPDNEEVIDTSAPLTMDEAIKAFTASEAATGADDGQTQAQEEQEATADDELLPDEDGEDDGDLDEDGQAEDQADDEPDDDDEEEIGQGRFAGNDAKVRLDDGTVVTIAELKSGSLRDKDYRQKTMTLAEERKAFEGQSAAVEQTKTAMQEERDYMVKLLQSLMPQAPDPAMLRTDPVGYMTQKDQAERFGQHLQFIQQQIDSAKQEGTQKTAQTRAERINTEWAQLMEKAPDLADRAKFQAFEAEAIKVGQEYGFSQQELNEVLPGDHRMALVLKDAMAYRRLQSKKAQQQAQPKQEKRPPVQRGGNRLSPQQQRARQADEAMSRLNKSGSLKDGVAAYLASTQQG